MSVLARMWGWGGVTKSLTPDVSRKSNGPLALTSVSVMITDYILGNLLFSFHLI